MLIGLLFGIFAQSQTAPLFAPIYSESANLLPAAGEKMRVGVIWRSSLEQPMKSSAGVTAVSFSTDPWSSPTNGGLLDFAASVGASDEFSGMFKGISVFTTFTGQDEVALCGEGAKTISGERIDAWSLWNPERIRWSATKMGTVNRTMDGLGFVTVGVYGEFGNACQFSGSLQGNEAQVKQFVTRGHSAPPGLGWWCGDSFGKASWQKAVIDKHRTIDEAYKDWKLESPSGPELPFPVGAEFPYVARLEFADWYRSGIANAVASLTDVAGEIFKKSQIMVPVGFATDFAQQANDPYATAEALKGGACLKATSLSYYDFATDWALSLGRIRGAARAVGCGVWAETGSGDATRATQSLFEAVALGASGVSLWPEQLTEEMPFKGYLRVMEPRCDVAVLYPSSTQQLRPLQAIPPLYLRGAVELRDYLDFDVLDESAVMAGALEKYRVAVLFEGSVWRAKSLQQIKNWVAGGGVITSYDFGKMADEFGSTEVWQDLFGHASTLSPYSATTKWRGAIPPKYLLSMRDRASENLQVGKWGSLSENGRAIENGSELILPVRPQSDATITLVFAESKAETGDVTISIGGRKQAVVPIGSAAARLELVLDRSQSSGGVITLGFGVSGSSSPILSEVILSVDEKADATRLVGGFESTVTTEQMKPWAKNVGKGISVFVPVKKELWREYIGGVRNVVYRLSRIVADREDAKNIDDLRDGVYTCDRGDGIVAFNSNSYEVAKPAPSEIALGPLELKEFRNNAPDAPIVLRCAEFEAVGSSERVEIEGESALHVPVGTKIATSVQIRRAGTYRVFVRALRNGKSAPVRVGIGGVEFVSSESAEGSEFKLVGELQLSPGSVACSLECPVEFKAYQVALTADKLISGFKFVKK